MNIKLRITCVNGLRSPPRSDTLTIDKRSMCSWTTVAAAETYNILLCTHVLWLFMYIGSIQKHDTNYQAAMQ